MTAEEQRQWYIEAVGHAPPPPKPESEPLSWQWAYRGNRADRERLAASLGSLDACRSPRPRAT